MFRLGLISCVLCAQWVAGNAYAQSETEALKPEENAQRNLSELESLTGFVSRINIEGTTQENAEAVRAVLGIKAGDEFNANAVRLAVKRIFLTGSYADVRVFAEETSAQRVTLTVIVLPDLLVGSIEIKSQRLPRDKLLRALPLRTGDRLARIERNEDATAAPEFAASLFVLKNMCQEFGYPDAQVSVRSESISSSESRVIFSIDEGEPLRLAKVILEGKFPYAKSELLRRLKLKVGEPFDRVRLDEGLLELTRELHEKRYLNARALIGEVKQKDRNASLTLRVDARARYRVRYIGQKALSHSELRTVIDEQKLSDLKAPSLERARRNIVQYFNDFGYPRAQVKTKVVPSLRHKGEREVLFVINEGERAFVKKISVKGSQDKSATEVENAFWRFVRTGRKSAGLFGRIARRDAEDALSTPSGSPQRLAARRTSFVGKVPTLGREEKPRKVTLDSARLTTIRPQEEGGGVGFPVRVVEPIYSAKLFEDAARHVADIYRSEGYLDVKLRGPEIEWSQDERSIALTFEISEGPKLNVGTVRFVPAPKVRISELLSESPVVPGSPLDLYALEQTREQIEDGLRERGYPFARVSEKLERNDKQQRANIVFQIEHGAEVTLGEIRIRGNERTQEFVILDRAQALKKGALYKASLFNAARAELLRSGLFTSVSVRLLDDENDKNVRDVLIEVRERSRYSVEAGVGASLEDGPRSYGTFSATNVFGFGLEGRIRAQLNYPRLFYAFVYDEESLENTPRKRIEGLGLPPVETAALFTEGQLLMSAQMPKVYGMPFPSRLHVDAVGLREIRPAFTLMKGSVLMGLDTRPLSWLQVEPQIEAEASDFDCASDLSLGKSCGGGNVGLVRRQDAGTIRQLSLRMLSSIDARDDPFRPHSGFFSSLSADLAFGDGELRTDTNADQNVAVDSNFFKLSSVVSGYVPLSNEITLALSLKAGNIFLLGDLNRAYVPLYKRFYSGGTGSVRGFREDQVLPVDDPDWPATSANPLNEGLVPTSLGGNFFLNARSELRVAIVGDVDAGFFLDAGQLANDPRNFAFDGFAVGGGAGVRYNTPVGPLAVDIGMKLLDGRRQLAPIFDGIPEAFSNGRLNMHFSIGYF